MANRFPPHAVRVTDDLWGAARQKAQQRGDILSGVIRDAFRRYTTRPYRLHQDRGEVGPPRSCTCPADLWEATQNMAVEQGVTVSEIARDALWRYVKTPS